MIAKPTKRQTAMINKSRDTIDVNALGQAIGIALGQVQSRHAGGMRVYKDDDPAAGIDHSIYGRNSIFDPCSTGDIIGLQVQTVGLMNWLGWRPNRFYRRHVDFIPWIGPEGLSGSGEITSGAGDPCDEPQGWEWANCGYDLCHTSWYHRGGDGLDPHTVVQDRCETTPRYRLNGVQITDDVEWQANGILSVLKMDIIHDLVHGSHLNANEMDGLESLVKTGWTDAHLTPCSQVDSILVNWLHDDLDGSGNNLGNFFDYLDEVVTEIEYKSSGLGTIAESDMILLTSRFMATCLLDAYACYTTCGVTTLNDSTDQALRAQQRQARIGLNAGPLYDGSAAVGYLPLKSGRRLPIIVDDAMTIDKPGDLYCTDIYLLTRRIGSMDVLYGEYLDLREYENRVAKVAVQHSMPVPRADAEGRFVFKGKDENWCFSLIVGTSPEIYISAPWAQARISNVCCNRKRQPVTGDVHAPTYLPGGRPLHHSEPLSDCGGTC